jgi:hypothetical protein
MGQRKRNKRRIALGVTVIAIAMVTLVFLNLWYNMSLYQYTLLNQQKQTERLESLAKSSDEYLDLLDEDIFMPTPINDTDRTLVVYSGPTSMNEREGKNELYLRNFDFFLKHGVDCTNHDTVVVVTEPVEQAYRSKIAALQQECQTQGHFVTTLIREPVCYDMESMRIVLYNSTLDVMSYDYFVYVNCGMSGPAPKESRKNDTLPWTFNLTSKLNEKIKMVGLSINCYQCNPHVQSFTFAVDRVGLEVLRLSNAIYNCRQSKFYLRPSFRKLRYEIIKRYEIGMSGAILNAGYGISSVLWETTIFAHNKTSCQADDYWTQDDLLETFCHLPSLNETIFFKTSRLLPQHIADQIGYQSEPNWTSRRPLLRLIQRQIFYGFPYRRKECVLPFFEYEKICC